MKNGTQSNKKAYYFFIGIVSMAILSTMSYSFYSSSLMINKYGPLIDATMEIKLETTTAHLWFEEKISGDRYESFDDIIDHIEQAKWYARAMLEGGENDEGRFLPLKEQHLRDEIAACLEQLNEFKRITNVRYNAFSTSGIGSDIDQRYDTLFRGLIRQIDHVETLLQKTVKRDYGRYRVLQVLLIIIVITLTSILLIIQYRHNRELKQNLAFLDAAKNRAEKSETWLKTTMNSMGDGVIITDQKGHISYLNPVASSLTGWHLEDAKDKNITEVFRIVNEYTKRRVENPVSIVIRKNVVVWLANHTVLISKDGNVWPISDSAAPIFDMENNLMGVVIVFHETTAQKKAEAEKRKLEAQLRQALKMEAIGTLAGGIAHDFNNILAMIIGNADMARDDIPHGNQAKHNIDEILKASNRAKELVRQILSFSRQEKSEKQPHSLPDLVAESMKSLHTTIPASVRQVINIDNTPGRDIVIVADHTQIHQLLLNLCVNAVQAMGEKGCLEVGVEKQTLQSRENIGSALLKPGVYGLLYVADNGPGIKPGHINRIFDPFFTTKEVGEGTGMGLSVVHGIVEDHGGGIRVETSPETGTTFRIYFPLTEQKAENEPVEIETFPKGDEHILLVDDEPMLIDVGRKMLKKQGYMVTTMTDSLEALALINERPSRFDLVITDQTMPNLTGAELAERVVKLNPALPIILCSGYSSRIDKEKAEQIGISAFVSKPLKRTELLRLIRRLLDHVPVQ